MIPTLNGFRRPAPPEHIEGMIIEDTPGGPRFWLKHGEVNAGELFAYSIGKHIYTSTRWTGQLDALFAKLSIDEMAALLAHKYISPRSHSKYRLKLTRNRNDWTLEIRQGKKAGRISNVYTLVGNGRDIQQIQSDVDSALQLFGSYGFAVGDFRTAGTSAASLIPHHYFDGNGPYFRLPESFHVDRFMRSYRGARSESVVFGKVDHVYDYDLNSAFPSVLAETPWFIGLKWVDSPNIPNVAEFAAALCDVQISEDLNRGPISVRHGIPNIKQKLASPIGPIKRARLNLPEIRLLQRNPEIGKITKVHAASWAYRQSGYAQVKPYKVIVEKLWKMRQENESFADYIKLVSNCLYGLFGSVYSGTNNARATWNPVISSHITSYVRVLLFRIGAGRSVNEAADGIATTEPIPTQEGLGGIKLEGQGSATFYDYHMKDRDWKRLPEYLQESTNDLNSFDLYGTQESRYNAAYLLNNNKHHKDAGKPYYEEFRTPLGSPLRSYAGCLQMSDMKSRVDTKPLTMNQLKTAIA